MARMLDGMEALLRGEVAPPPAATLLGMRLASFAPGEPGPASRTPGAPSDSSSAT